MARVLLEQVDRMAQQVGRPVILCRVAEIDQAKAQASAVPAALITNNAKDLLASPDVDIVLELIGGEHPALEYLTKAISQHKHVVTANKELMAKHGPEVISLAERHGVHLLYEASVGGGIPVIGPLKKDLQANQITSLRAIINGTTNYILTRMSREGLDFGTALAEAQAAGYAEADPSNDIEGFDAVYKLAILATLAFHINVRVADIFREGISELEARDFQYAKELGYAIKLLALARCKDDSLSLRVHPALVPQEDLIAKVDGVFNAIEINGDLVGPVLFHGQGAGPSATCSAVIGDVLEIARGIASGGSLIGLRAVKGNLHISPMEELRTRYYMRLTVADQAGVLAQIAKRLGDQGISIASVIQKNATAADQTAEIVVTTHPAQEAAMQEALGQLDGLDVLRKVGSLIRIERWSSQLLKDSSSPRP